MLGGCCVCLGKQRRATNPLVYCDGQGCNVAVHKGVKFPAIIVLKFPHIITCTLENIKPRY